MSQTLSMALTPRMLQIEAGETASVTITLLNLGSEVEQYVLAIEGIDPFWYSASAYSITLASRSQSEIQLTLHPPRTGEVRAGTYAFVVKAISRSKPDDITAVEMMLQLEPFAGLELDLVPRSLAGNEGAFQVHVANWSGADCALALSARDREDALTFEFQPSFLVLQEGQSVDVPLKAQPKRGRLFGSAVERDFQVMAAPPGEGWDSEQSHVVTGVLIDKPDLLTLRRLKLPRVALVAVAVAVLGIAAVAGAWALMRPVGAPSMDSPGVVSQSSAPAPASAAPISAAATATAEPSKPGGVPLIQRFLAQRAEDKKNVTLVWDVRDAEEVRLNGNVVRATGTQPATMDRDGAYTLVARNGLGTSTSTVYVVMVCPPAVLSFNVSPSAIQPGQSATLSWDSFGASQADIDGQPRPVRGTLSVAPAQSTRYVLTAMNGAGTSQSEVFLDVGVPRTATPTPTLPPLPTVPAVTPAPRLERPTSTPVPLAPVSPPPTAAPAVPPRINAFSAAPALVTHWGTTVLSWNVSNAYAVLIEPGPGPVAPSGSVSVVVPQSTTYVLTALDAAGQAIMASLDVATIDPPYIATFNVPEKATLGSAVNLSWTTTGASEIVITWNDDQGGHSRQTYTQSDGSVQITPVLTSPRGVVFTLTAKNQSGTTATAVRSMTTLRP